MDKISLRMLLEEPADFLNPYWYEELNGINWQENGNSLVLYDEKTGPFWNPHFPSSLFLNHGIKRIHLDFTARAQEKMKMRRLQFFIDILPRAEKIILIGNGFHQTVKSETKGAEELFRSRKCFLLAPHPDCMEPDFDLEKPSFSRFRRILHSSAWGVFPEGNGFSIFSTMPIGKQLAGVLAKSAEEKNWTLYWVKNLYDFTFLEKENFTRERKLPPGVKQLA